MTKILAFILQIPLSYLGFYALDKMGYGTWYVAIPLMVVISFIYDLAQELKTAQPQEMKV